MKSIAIFFGSKSLEHDVSIITGVMTANSLDGEKYNRVPVYIDKDGVWYTGESLLDIGFYKDIDYRKLKRVTLVCGSSGLWTVKGKKLKLLCSLSAGINCIHGDNGEDGSLYGLLKLSNIPCVSSPLFASSCCMDKGFTKTVLKGLRVPVINGAVITDEKDIEKKIWRLKFPLIVKPCGGGSSIGIKKVKNIDELETAIKDAKRYGDRVLVENYVKDCIEINCAAFSGKDGTVFVSDCERPVLSGEILSFSDKYVKGEREFPAKISASLTNRIRRRTERIYKNINASGVIRVDYIVKGEEIFVNEINTVPGSMAYYLFCEKTNEFTEMLNEMIESEMQKFAKRNTEIRTFNTSVLSGVGTKGAKRL